MTTDESAEKRIVSLLERRSGDAVALDAFGQLASDPSGITARDRGYATWEELSQAVSDNLALRWSISQGGAMELVRRIAKETEGWIGDADVDLTIRAWLAGPRGEPLRRDISKRLEAGDQRAFRFAQVIAAYVASGELQTQLRDYLWERLLAGYVAAWGELAPREVVEDGLVRSGLYSRLPYTSSTGRTCETILVLTPVFAKDWMPTPATGEQAAEVLTRLEAREDWEQFRLLDEVAGASDHFSGQMTSSGLTRYIRPLPGIMGSHGNVWSVSPFCGLALTRILTELKRRLLGIHAANVDETLTAERNRRWPSVECTRLDIHGAEPECWWRWTAKDAPPIVVCLAPWLLRRSLSRAVSYVRPERDDLLILTSYQTVPALEEFFKALGPWQPFRSVVCLSITSPRDIHILLGTASSEIRTLAETLSVGLTRHAVAPSPTLRTPVPSGDSVAIQIGTKREKGEGKPPEERSEVGVEGERREVEQAGIATELCIGSETVAPQYGILGWAAGEKHVFLDLNSPKTISIFGRQEAGKSYTVGVIAEMSLLSIPKINHLVVPLAVIVFHYSKDEHYAPEYAMLRKPNDNPQEVEVLSSRLGASPVGIKDLVIVVPPHKLEKRRQEYVGMEVHPLLFDPVELRIEDWLMLMAASDTEALYMEELRRVLKNLENKGELCLRALYETIGASGLNKAQQRLAITRLGIAEQYMADNSSLKRFVRPGALTLLDLRDDMLESEEAMRLCLITLKLFSGVETDGQPISKLIILDEAHKYMGSAFATEIQTVVREMRHTATSALIASQDPLSIPDKVIGLSSVVICHRITDGRWVKHIKSACEPLAGLAAEQLSQLKRGEAFVWADKATPGAFATGPVRIQVRPRVTKHGGYTVSAL